MDDPMTRLDLLLDGEGRGGLSRVNRWNENWEGRQGILSLEILTPKNGLVPLLFEKLP